MFYSDVSFINCEALCFTALSYSIIVRPCVLLRCLIHLLWGLVFFSVVSCINCEALCFTPLPHSLIVRSCVLLHCLIH